MENIASRILDSHAEFMEQGMAADGGKWFAYSGYLDVMERRANSSGSPWTIYGMGFSARRYMIPSWHIGNGEVRVLAWSQMHGNEPVSTLALLDVMNFLESGHEIAVWLRRRCSIVAIPMLNPEGHINRNRRNSMGIDINRDAMDLQSAEARFLMETYQLHKPDLALNLHDQEDTYTPGQSPYQTLVSLLAPECDAAGSVTGPRRRAMGVCGALALMLGGIFPDRISRYQDSYTPTAFGDTFMRLGASAVLIEAGAYRGDRSRSVARRAVFLSVLAAMIFYVEGAADGGIYNLLPVNQRGRVLLLRMRGLRIMTPEGQSYTADIGIQRVKTSLNPEDFADDFSDCRVMNIGNLDSYAAEYEFDASGYTFCGQSTDMYVTRPADFDIRDTGNRIMNVKNIIENY